jgi:hypothetical protein
MSLLLLFPPRTVVVVTGNASLGSTTSTASATVTKVVTGDGSLGSLVGVVTAGVTKVVTGDGSLGSLVGVVTAGVTHDVAGNGSLGSTASTASATVTKVVAGDGSLGSTTGTASATVTHDVAGDAPLGMLSGTVTISNEPVIPPSGSRWWTRPTTPVVKQPIPDPIYVQVPQPKQPVVVSAQAGSRLGGLNVSALGSVTFSILDDDAEVLLLV